MNNCCEKCVRTRIYGSDGEHIEILCRNPKCECHKPDKEGSVVHSGWSDVPVSLSIDERVNPTIVAFREKTRDEILGVIGRWSSVCETSEREAGSDENKLISSHMAFREGENWKTVADALIDSVILTIEAKARREEREKMLSQIKNGGTGDSILMIQHNGETFLNERQLLDSLSALMEGK